MTFSYLQFNFTKLFTYNLLDMKNSRKIAEMQHRQQYGDRDFKKSGQGPVPKTYKYNPKVTKDTDKYL